MRAHIGLFVALLLASSGASAQSSTIDNPDEGADTTLFFHLDANQDFPINTQPPDDKFAKGSTRGVLASTTTCSPDGSPGQASQDHHTVYGFSTPGYVEYEFTEDGGPRIHPERGLAYDVELDTSTDMTGYWYLKTTVDQEQGPTEVNNLPVLVPQVTVQFTMRTGDQVSFGAESYNDGQIIAKGQSVAVDLLPSDQNPNYRPQEDGSHVYEIPVPMEIEMDTIPSEKKTGSYNMRVDVFTDVPGCDSDSDSTFMPGSVEVYTSPEYRPRIELAIMNPVRIDYIHPQFIGDDLLIHTSLNSPWGNYDVDEGEGGISMNVTGPTAGDTVFRVAFEQRHHEHGYHFQAVDVTYQWDYEADQADPDLYELVVTVWNDQHTAFATGTATIDVGSLTATDDEGNLVQQLQSEDQESPGINFIPILALLCAATLVIRRS
jgi:hypothetical protein